MNVDLEARAFIRRGDTLVPADIHAEEFLHSVKDGNYVLVTVRKPRSVRHHRWFFACLRLVMHEHPGVWDNETELLEDLKDVTGHVERSPLNQLTGKERRYTKSINFASMGEAKFVLFRTNCLRVIQEKLGMNLGQLMEQTDAAIRPNSWIKPTANGRSPSVEE